MPIYRNAAQIPTNGNNWKKFQGNGISFKGKIIGIEDLSKDCDETMCLDAMFKLKAVVRARGEHKQKIQLNLTLDGIKITEESYKVEIALHDIERISFIVTDPRDTRAFGYIYNTTDNRHQFWAIKTEQSAAITVVAFNELFQAKLEQEKTIPTEESSSTSTETSSASIPQPVQLPTVPLFDNIWGDNSLTTNPRPRSVSSMNSHDNNKSVSEQISSVENSSGNLYSIPPPPPAPTRTYLRSFSSVSSDDAFSMSNTASPRPVGNPFNQQPSDLFKTFQNSSIVSPSTTNSINQTNVLEDFSSKSKVLDTTPDFVFPPPPPSARRVQQRFNP